MKTQIDKTSSVRPKIESSTWDSGWYLYEDGSIVGPLRAEEAFYRGETTPNGQMRMVSRKGFSQWYPIRDFSELHALAGRYADQLAQTQMEAVSSSGSSFVPRGVDSVSLFGEHEPVAKVVGPNYQNSSPTSSPSVHRVEHRRKDKRKKGKHRTEHLAVENNANTPTEPERATTFADQYLLVGSRLRLGRIRNPMAISFAYTPATLGGYWGFWFTQMAEELAWHLSGSSRKNFVLPLWMVMIPGVHLILAWMLSSLAADVERQNGYQTIRPWFATILAIFPPFFMLQIQSAMNRHWELHVKHSHQVNA